MIQLRGKLTVQRIGGSINVVPTAGSPPLQGKVVIPTHDEQLIKPDEEYYGLSVVTVAAVPKLPAAETKISYDEPKRVRMSIKLGVIPVLTEVVSGDPYYYNYEQFPEIPNGITVAYPYLCILRTLTTVYLYGCSERGSYRESQSLNFPTGSVYCRYRLNTELNAWILDDSGSGGSVSLYAKSTTSFVVWWSNYDILVEGSENGEVFFPASEFALNRPTAEPTHCYFKTMFLPAIPADVLATHPYAWIRNNDDTGHYELLLSSGVWYALSAYALGHDDSGDVKYYRIPKTEADTANEWEFYQSSTASSWTNSGNQSIVWANQNVLNSKGSTAIYWYGNMSVPYPV